MAEFNQLLVTFLNPLILMIALVFGLSIVSRQRWETMNSDLLLGGVFSLAVIYALSSPIELPNVGQYDMRGLIIGIAAAMFGPKVGGMVFATAFAIRVGIGNPGLAAGIANISLALLAGCFWYRFAKDLKWPELLQSITLAVLLSINTLAIFLAPQDRWAEYFSLLLPYTLVCNLLGVTLIRYLARYEMSFLQSTKGLEEAASTDHLTGLHNRRSLEAKLQELKSRQHKWFGRTAICFDIDKFKEINDTYGHAAGDAVLQVVSSRLSATFRSEDIFSRIGGDEFVVILPNLPKGEAHNVAERCRSLVAETPVIVGGHIIHATISVGAVWTEEDSDFKRLMQLADKALYQAKSNGRNAVAFGVERGKALEYAGVAAA